MRTFLAIVGIVFALIVAAHIARLVAEPHTMHEPWFWLLTLIAAGLSGWAWYLWWTFGSSNRR